MKKKLYLVDASAMFFRAFFAIRELKTTQGLPTNALYGFLSMTVKLLNEFSPEYIVYCMDRKEASFRKDIDPNYKANRVEMPEDLEKQMPYIERIIDVLGLPKMSEERHEADDVIGSLASWGEKNNFEVVVVSGDKDFAQIVTDKTSMFDPVKSKNYFVEDIKQRWGVYPHQFIDYLSLVGDSSDNIPGVKGIGPKGAEKLLNEYKSLDGVYKNIESIKGSIQKKLIENKEQAYLSKKLVTIVKNLNLVDSEKELLLKEKNLQDVENLFTELEFTSFLKNFNKEGKEIKKEKEEEKIESAVNIKIKSGEEITYFYFANEAYLVTQKNVYKLPHQEEELNLVRQKLEKSSPILSGFGVKELLEKLDYYHTEVSEDLKLICYSISGEEWTLTSAIKKFLGKNIDETTSISEVVESIYELKKYFSEYLSEKPKFIYEQIELPLQNVLLDMEMEGVLLEKNMLEKQSEELKAKIDQITEDVYGMVDRPFNIASPKQLAKVLFEDLGLKPLKKTKTGFSTNTDVLEKLKAEHPIAQKVIDFREYSKLKSTYVDALPKLISPKTKRIHTTYNQALTTTGRLSSNNPNLQNIPIRTEEGRKIRKAFVAKKDHVLVSADYSQVELRILAHICKDKGLIEAFKSKHDVHSKTAAEVFGIDIDEVTTEQRRVAKAVNFGIAYGQGAYGLSEALGISRAEAKKIIDNYFEKFSSVKNYIEETIKFAKEHFYTETLLGRRREIEELKSSNKMIQKFGERAAINAPIQGTAADIIKLAMIKAHKEVKSPLLLQVHDELVFEVKESDVDKEMKLIKEIMETVYLLDVPIEVSIGYGSNWDEAH